MTLKRMKSCRTQRLLFIHPSVHVSFSHSERTALRLEMAAFKSTEANQKPERADPRSERTDLRPEIADSNS